MIMMDNGFNPDLLRMARQYRGMSQHDVAERAGFKQSYYSRIEGGLLPGSPPEDSIAQIAEALSFPLAFFYQHDRVSGLPLSVHAFNRKKAAVSETGLKRLHAELNIRALHVRRLLNAVDVEKELPLPKIDVDAGGGPREIARKVRLAWRAPPGPIKSLTDYAERAGILIIWFDFDEAVDGVTMCFPDIPPCIFLNRKTPADRMRFSLAHEIGHAVMHTIPTDDMEDEANVFAAELLCPEKELKVDLIGHLTLEKLARLKAYWRVSMQFLLFQAKDLGCISANQSQYLWRQISMLGWRTREPVETDIEPESPQMFPRLITLHAEDLGYGEEEFSRLLHLKKEEVRTFYGAYGAVKKHGHLYAVK